MQTPKNILFFDGVCNLCNASVAFILKREKSNKLLYASLQGETAKEILKNKGDYIDNLSSIVLYKNNKIYDKSTAALLVAKDLKVLWPLFYYLFIWWPKPIRDTIYSWIAKNRYKWFGKQEQCMIPEKSVSHRFLT